MTTPRTLDEWRAERTRLYEAHQDAEELKKFKALYRPHITLIRPYRYGMPSSWMWVCASKDYAAGCGVTPSEAFYYFVGLLLSNNRWVPRALRDLPYPKIPTSMFKGPT